MDALFLAYKPPFTTSNAFLQRLKKHHHITKAGFSGTLDPFAQGSLLIATGAYTKLLPFIPTEPKVYETTLWLGTESKSLDTENITHIAPPESIAPVSPALIARILENLRGEIAYTPPAFSAKRLQGKRAYDLARAGESVQLAQATMYIYDITLLGYNHPFISFRAHVSKGAYIRSLGQIIAQNLSKELGRKMGATLSALKRISEGGLQAESGKLIMLNPLEILPFSHLVFDEHTRDYFKDRFYHGKPTTLRDKPKILHNKHATTNETARNKHAAPPTTAPQNLENPESKNSTHIVQFDDFFSIIQLHRDGRISYLLNRMPYAHTL